MKYWFGYLTAAIFGAITWVLMRFGERFSTLVDMVYPYVIRTSESILAQWASGVDFPIWQLLAVALGALILASIVLMIVLKWNPIQWGGWVLAVFAGIYMLHTILWGLNYYSGPLSDDMRLDVGSYNLEELTEATEYYRDKANALALEVNRDGSGNVTFADFDALAGKAGEGFQTLTYDYFYPIFAGSTLPVKKLGWADMYSSMGITGFTFPLTGEAAVNPQIPASALPFTMCHEMAHRMCIASERDANFAAFLACSFNPNLQYQYSAYFMAYRYCYTALASVGKSTTIDPQLVRQAAEAASRIDGNVNQYLRQDMEQYEAFFRSHRNAMATNLADTINDAYLKASGETAGVASYGEVCDLLVNWHIQEVVLPALVVVEERFDPYDETQVDLSGIVNAKEQY